MDATEDCADFALLTSSGHLTYGCRRPDESIFTALRREIPDLSTQGLGQLRMWFTDVFTAELPDNHLADEVIGRLGYHHLYGWAGPVALTLEEDPHTGDVPALTPEVRATLDELAQASTPQQH